MMMNFDTPLDCGAVAETGVFAVRAIEALLGVGEGPLSVATLAAVAGISEEEVEGALSALAVEYAPGRRGMVLAYVAGGYELRTAPELAAVVGRLLSDGGEGRLKAASLEALAVVAYLQPVSRAQISEVRGINSDAVVRGLAIRGLIAGDREQARPGEPVLYSTTPVFLQRFGLGSIEELPELSQFVPSVAVIEGFEDRLRKG